MADGAKPTDDCYRCGYNLVGIDNLQPCPECGLLAERSRHVSDELHQTRPKWLRKLSWGIWLMLIAGIVALVGPMLVSMYPYNFTYFTPAGVYSQTAFFHVQYAPRDLAAILLLLGFALLSSREGYPPADKADLLLRRWLRLAPLAPILALAVVHYVIANDDEGWWRFSDLHSRWSSWIVLVLETLGCIPMPLLVAFRLRGLAKRAGSAHLAEHCVIVGVGVALTLLYAFFYYVADAYAESWGWGGNWSGRGWPSLIVIVVMIVLIILMILWAIYLLVRFAIAFATASSKLRGQWRRDDRAVVAFAG